MPTESDKAQAIGRNLLVRLSDERSAGNLSADAYSQTTACARVLMSSAETLQGAFNERTAALTECGDARHRAENERDALRECLLAAVAFVECYTGNGCSQQPPEWADPVPGSGFDASRIAQVSRAVLATIAAPDMPEAARATVLHIADRAARATVGDLVNAAGRVFPG